MADVVKTEAIAKAVVSESIAAAPTAGAEATAVEMIKRAGESNWAEGFRYGAEHQVAREDVFGRIDQIGADRDATTGARVRAAGSPEEARHNAATTAADLAFKFKDQGYDGLGIGEKTTVRTRIEGAILQSPRLAAEYNRLTPTEKNSFLLRLAKDNVYSGEVTRVLSEFSQKSGIDDSASDKQIILDQKTTEQAVKQSELADAQRRLRAIETRLSAFDSSTTPPGPKSVEMERIRAAIPTLQAEAANFQQQVEDKTFRLAQLQQEREQALRPVVRGATVAIRPLADIDTEIGIVRGELQTANQGLNARTADINKLPLLEQEQADLENKRLDLAREESEKSIAKGKVDSEFARAQRDYQDALILRQRQEQDIVDSLNGVFSEAARGLVDKQIEALGQQFEASLSKIKTEGLSADQKALLDQLHERWMRVLPNRRFGGRSQPRRVLNQAQINTDFNTLMTSGDEAFIRSVLLTTENPNTPGTNYTPDQITELFKNKEFMETARPDALEKLVAHKAIIGGVEPADVYAITTSRWGENLITNALKTNDAFRGQLEGMYGKDAIDQPGFTEKLRREAQNNPNLLTIITLMLAGAGGAVVGAPLLGTLGAGALAAGSLRAGLASSGQNRMFG